MKKTNLNPHWRRLPQHRKVENPPFAPSRIAAAVRVALWALGMGLVK